MLREIVTPLIGSPWPWFPTQVINVVACFLIGLIYGRLDRLHPGFVHFVAIGFCGGLSTF